MNKWCCRKRIYKMEKDVINENSRNFPTSEGQWVSILKQPTKFPTQQIWSRDYVRDIRAYHHKSYLFGQRKNLSQVFREKRKNIKMVLELIQWNATQQRTNYSYVNSISAFQKHWMKKVLDIKQYILYDTIYMKFKNSQNEYVVIESQHQLLVVGEG